MGIERPWRNAQIFGHGGQRLLFAEWLKRVHGADNAPRVITPSVVVGRRFVEDAQDRTQFFLGEHPGRRRVSGGATLSLYFAILVNLTSSRRQTLPRYGGGFQVCRLVGSRFFASDSSPAPLRGCPPLLFYSFRAISISMYHQVTFRAAIDSRRQRDTVSMAASRAIL